MYINRWPNLFLGPHLILGPRVGPGPVGPGTRASGTRASTYGTAYIPTVRYCICYKVQQSMGDRR